MIKIKGTGSFLPANTVTNDFMATIVDTSDEWIASRTGIRSRHLVKEETTSYMAVQAGAKALEEAGVAAEDIDLILVATITADCHCPSTACEVQAALGAVNAVAFDIQAACSGFLFALNTAVAYFQAGIYKNALIIGAETLSKILDWSDRSTCVLFGDGAGAAVVQADKENLYDFVQFSDGARGNVLTCNSRTNQNPLIEAEDETKKAYLVMEGQEVFKFAVKMVPDCIEKLLNKTGTQTEDIDCFLLHQANERIIQSVAKRLHMPIERFPMNLSHCGNTSAASIPILLDEANKKGWIKRGDMLVLSGFGAGLTWSAAQLKW